ncbi:MAG: 4Fe-4S binding protein [Gracilibacteraceae bacterium]|jgi:carbon-monoxide dehydrogenase iron sulfur subunit|nr:4Fe-4S binding protein [Gracilibacteraceae bacterium]
MKRIYVNEKWCLGCHLCEYYCAFANSGQDDMAKALKDVVIHPRIQIEEQDNISFAVNCRHCEEPLCVKGCISGALSVRDGLILIDADKCVSCYTCVLSCPYGAIMPSAEGAIQKCELCVKNGRGQPACVEGCPNMAIVFEER